MTFHKMAQISCLSGARFCLVGVADIDPSIFVGISSKVIKAKVDWHLTQPGENRSNYVFVINAVSCLPFPSMLKIKRAHPEWRGSAFLHKANEQCET
jgi:hypothetical protein